MILGFWLGFYQTFLFDIDEKLGFFLGARVWIRVFRFGFQGFGLEL
jgi:hypothetical protein